MRVDIFSYFGANMIGHWVGLIQKSGNPGTIIQKTNNNTVDILFGLNVIMIFVKMLNYVN